MVNRPNIGILKMESMCRKDKIERARERERGKIHFSNKSYSDLVNTSDQRAHTYTILWGRSQTTKLIYYSVIIIIHIVYTDAIEWNSFLCCRISIKQKVKRKEKLTKSALININGIRNSRPSKFDHDIRQWLLHGCVQVGLHVLRWNKMPNTNEILCFSKKKSKNKQH